MGSVPPTDSEPRRLGCLEGQQSLKAPNFEFGAFSFNHGHHEFRRDDQLARAHEALLVRFLLGFVQMSQRPSL